MKPRGPCLTVADIARMYGIPPSTIRRWAQHDRWQHTGTRPRRYALADAQRSWEAHRKTSTTLIRMMFQREDPHD